MIDIMSTLRLGNRSFICTKGSVSIYPCVKEETYFSLSGPCFHDPFGGPFFSQPIWVPTKFLWPHLCHGLLKLEGFEKTPPLLDQRLLKEHI